ncbi:MAG: hypothetical protein H0W36_08160 [Gemmatimonadetes bacterium]|nr:hypothetical protein [Gemmatimonadota bacterium]
MPGRSIATTLFTDIVGSTEARESYEKFLVAWQDAEPSVRPRVERARQRLAGIAPLRQE